jgi:transposase-like protein
VERRYSFPVEIFTWEERLHSGPDLGKVTGPGRAPSRTILFIPLSADQINAEADWAEASAKIILRRCPICSEDSIIGHGRRRKQAHDENHDWIGIRRGLCHRCGKTFTFLPAFSPPYGHYSLVARSQALRHYFVEGRSWEGAAPATKDPDRVADPSTLHRWFRNLDSSQPAFSFLRPMVLTIGARLSKTEMLIHDSMPLCWHTVFPFLARFWPLRL